MTVKSTCRSDVLSHLARLFLIAGAMSTVVQADDVYIDTDTTWTQAGSDWIYLGTLGKAPTLTLGNGGSAFAVESYQGASILVDGGQASQAAFVDSSGDFMVESGSVGDVYFNGGAHGIALRGGSVTSLYAWQASSGTTLAVSGGNHGTIDTFGLHVGGMTGGTVSSWAGSLDLAGGAITSFAFSEGESVLSMSGGSIGSAALDAGRGYLTGGAIGSVSLGLGGAGASLSLTAVGFEYTLDGSTWTSIGAGIYSGSSILNGALGLRASDQSWSIGSLTIAAYDSNSPDDLTVADDGENWWNSYIVLEQSTVPGPGAVLALCGAGLCRRRQR